MGLALLGALVVACPAPRAYRSRPARMAVFQRIDVPLIASPDRVTRQPQAVRSIRDGEPSEREALPHRASKDAWIYVYVVRHVGCFKTDLYLSIESDATDGQERFLETAGTTGFFCRELPSCHDYVITAACYENAGEGLVRRRFGRATVPHLLGSAVVYLRLDEEETFEDRT